MSIKTIIFAFVTLLTGALVMLIPIKSFAQSGCQNIPTSNNSVSNTISISQAGNYSVLSRILANNTASNSYFLQIDGGCAITVGDSPGIPVNQWTWVNYQDGATTHPINIHLTSGNHTVKIIERESGVGIDKIVFTQDASCVPAGTGENCTVLNTPVVTMQPTLAPRITPTPANQQTYTTGWQPWNGTFDSGNNNWISSTQVTTGYGSGALQSISVYMGNVTSAPNNLIQVGIYADNGSNLPGSFLGSSATQTITPNSWNTLSLGNVSVLPNTKYWLAFVINGSTTQFGWYNQTGGLSRWKNNVPFGTWPATFGSPDYATTQRYAIYMTYSGTGTPVIPTNTPLPTNTSIPTPPGDKTAPVVSITYPTNGTFLQRNKTVSIQAQASDNMVVSRVEFYVNGVLKGTDISTPYSYNWLVPNKRNTSYNVSARAYDASGNIGISNIVTVRTSR